MKSPEDVIREWVNYFNTREPEKLASLYHEDATNLQIAVGVPLVGREAMLKDFREFFANIPDNFTNLEQLIINGDRVTIEWTGGGTFKPTGKSFTMQGCGFFLIVDGKIKSQRGYWDMAKWCKAIGVPLES